LTAEIARRFDPTIDDTHLPTTLDDLASFQVVATWREVAWRNAERLVSAPTPEARALVAQSIEDDAAATASAIKLATSYVWPFSTSASSDAFCAAHKGAAAPIPYAFGVPSPW
jgi:hypothetical protein